MNAMDSEKLLPWIAFLIAFAIGSIPFGLLVARLYKVRDLRDRGSGNIGTTNVSRVIGFWPAGVITFVLDFIKGALPVFLVFPEGAALWAHALGADPESLQPWVRWVAAFFAVLGHCYSPWLRFNGGKGVATALGAILLLSPVAAGAGILAFACAFLLKRIVSLSSLAGLIMASIAYLVFHESGPYLMSGAAMIFVIFIRHESNLDALLEDRENVF